MYVNPDDGAFDIPWHHSSHVTFIHQLLHDSEIQKLRFLYFTISQSEYVMDQHEL